MIRIAVILLLLATTTAQAQTPVRTWRFGLIGDVPYTAHERAQLPSLLAAMGTHDLDLVAHIGDIKSGKTPCSDTLYRDRFTLFNASPAAFVYVPGDNEWLDCTRLSAGHYDVGERLEALRRIFFAEARSLGKAGIPLARQEGPYVEHARFRLGPVLFVTLNVPGGNNNFGLAPGGSSEFKARNPVVLAWLHSSFKQARRARLKGIVVLMQADPHFEDFSRGTPHGGYRALLETLREETRRFAGQVVVVHGDTHRSRIDHPLYDKDGNPIRNFTRVETFGYPAMGWTLGIIDPADPQLFRFHANPWFGNSRAPGTMLPTGNPSTVAFPKNP
ncbi:MAG TPA: hypothetical protein PLW86_02475 [Rhodocyclaceae bacterium]|nr:hypothetical protein [Rhodocyclaceae bacterium]